MKRSDDWTEMIETWATCPHCFREVKLSGIDHRMEDEIVGCPGCGQEFELGEPA